METLILILVLFNSDLCWGWEGNINGYYYYYYYYHHHHHHYYYLEP